MHDVGLDSSTLAEVQVQLDPEIEDPNTAPAPEDLFGDNFDD